MATLTRIPMETLAAYGLKDGDHVEGEVKGDALELCVTAASEGAAADAKRRREALEWLEEWKGAFANPDIDVSKDPRLEYLLNK